MFVTEVPNLVDYIIAWVSLSSELYISDFLYLVLRSGQRRALSIMSLEKKKKIKMSLEWNASEYENASRSVCTDSNNPNLLESWWFGTAVSRNDQGAFLANALLKGHQIIGGYSFFLSIALDWKEIERWGWFHIVFVSSRCVDLDWNATWPIPVITWPWPETKSWPWPFKVKSYIFSVEASYIEALLREKHDDAIADYLCLLV